MVFEKRQQSPPEIARGSLVQGNNMKKLIQSSRAHSIPPYYMATTFTVRLNLDMVPGAMHTIEDAATVIIDQCSYLLAAMIDTGVAPGSRDVIIHILGALDSVPGAFHQPEDHVEFIRSGSCRSYVKDVTFDPNFKYAYLMRGQFNKIAEAGDLFKYSEITG
jgi:hypothetical protein